VNSDEQMRSIDRIENGTPNSRADTIRRQSQTLPAYCFGGEVNESTVRLVRGSLENQNRHYALASKIALLCRDCNEVRPVTDLFPNGEAKLEPCGHRRPLAYRKREDVAAYDVAIAAKKKRAVAA
jgi:hypothetical protein